jgi:hypothetical protein
MLVIEAQPDKVKLRTNNVINLFILYLILLIDLMFYTRLS